jgi:hypothetical protein
MKKWVFPGAASKCDSQALLFEYLPDLTPLTKELVTEELAVDIKQVLARLHALNVLHRDLDELNAYPDIGFRNIFLRTDASTGRQRQCFPPPLFYMVLTIKS